MGRKLEKNIELALLSILIIFEVAEFFGILPGDLEFIEKTVSWIALAYLFVKASLSSILFGYKKARFDIAIVFAYLLFVIKDIIRCAEVVIEEPVLLREFYSFVIGSSLIIEKYFFYTGGILLIIISLYVAMKIEVKKPSLMAVIHETGKPPEEIKDWAVRFTTIFLVLVAFFVVVFNLAAEWLAIALDTPLIVAGILLYLFVVIRHHKRFNTRQFIYKVGRFGEDFYSNFVRMFHYKKTIYLGVMGLLALHLLTDMGTFIVPYIIGLKETMYVGNLGAGHTPLAALLAEDVYSVNWAGAVVLVAAYLLNAVAIIFLLVLPAWIWYRFFRKRPLHVSRTFLAWIFSSLLAALLAPAFFIERITLKDMAGVDILTQSILKSSSIIDFLIKDRMTAIGVAVLVSIAIGMVIWFLEFNKKIKKDIFIIAILIGLLFFGFYIYYYFISVYQYYIAAIISLIKLHEFLIVLYFILFAMFAIMFYIGGYALFVYEVFRRHFFRHIDKYLK